MLEGNHGLCGLPVNGLWHWDELCFELEHSSFLGPEWNEITLKTRLLSISHELCSIHRQRQPSSSVEQSNATNPKNMSPMVGVSTLLATYSVEGVLQAREWQTDVASERYRLLAFYIAERLMSSMSESGRKLTLPWLHEKG